MTTVTIRTPTVHIAAKINGAGPRASDTVTSGRACGPANAVTS